MKLIKQGCFVIIFIILISAIISSISKSKEEYSKKLIEPETSIEETTKIIRQKKETKDYELDFIGIKRLKKNFGDSLLKAFISIEENNEEEFVEQMKAIDNILTELELKKKVGVHEEVEELLDLFIEDIKTTVDMLIALFDGLEEYDELHKKVIELDDKFLNEYNRIENKLK